MSALTDGAVVLLLTTQNPKCTLLVVEFNEMCPDLKVTSEAAESESMKGIQDKALALFLTHLASSQAEPEEPPGVGDNS